MIETPAPRIDVDPSLAEVAVLRTLTRDPEAERDYHRRADPLYALSGEARRRAFEELHLALLRETGLLRPLEEAIARIGPGLQRVERTLVGRALRPSEEGADIAPASGGRYRLGVRIAASRLLEKESLEGFLRHEIELVRLMLDPAFGYDRDALRGVGAAEEARRERFALLWSLHADARIASRGEGPAPAREPRLRALAAGFPRLAPEERAAVLGAIERGAALTHAQLVAASRSEQDLLRAFGVPRAGAEQPGPRPGDPCPLCRFPTFEWAAAPLAPEVVAEVRADFPAWQIADSACARCLEVYLVRCGRWL